MVDEILVIYLKCKCNDSFRTEKTEEFTDKLYLNSKNTLAKMTLTKLKLHKRMRSTQRFHKPQKHLSTLRVDCGSK